jgi:hypothetical protein
VPENRLPRGVAARTTPVDILAAPFLRAPLLSAILQILSSAVKRSCPHGEFAPNLSVALRAQQLLAQTQLPGKVLVLILLAVLKLILPLVLFYTGRVLIRTFVFPRPLISASVLFPLVVLISTAAAVFVLRFSFSYSYY